jgi:hypothetical protein
MAAYTLRTAVVQLRMGDLTLRMENLDLRTGTSQTRTGSLHLRTTFCCGITAALQLRTETLHLYPGGFQPRTDVTQSRIFRLRPRKVAAVSIRV